VEMSFKARSVNLGWLFFDRILPMAVFGFLWSRRSLGGSVFRSPGRRVICTREGFLYGPRACGLQPLSPASLGADLDL
jgi:hypothetical protein